MEVTETADTLEQTQAEAPVEDTAPPPPAPVETAPVETPEAGAEAPKEPPKPEPWETRFKDTQREYTRVSQSLAEERRARAETQTQLEVLHQALQEQLGWTDEDLQAQKDNLAARLKEQRDVEAVTQAQQARLGDLATRFQAEVSAAARELLDIGAVKEAVKLEASLLAGDYAAAAMILSQEHGIDVGSDLQLPEGASVADQIEVWSKGLERLTASARKVTQKAAVKATETKLEARQKALEEEIKELKGQYAALEAQSRAVSTSTGGGAGDPDAQLWLRYGQGESLTPDELKRVRAYARTKGLG